MSPAKDEARLRNDEITELIKMARGWPGNMLRAGREPHGFYPGDESVIESRVSRGLWVEIEPTFSRRFEFTEKATGFMRLHLDMRPHLEKATP